MPNYRMYFETLEEKKQYAVDIGDDEVIEKVLQEILIELSERGHVVRGLAPIDFKVLWGETGRVRELDLSRTLPEQGVRPDDVLRVILEVYGGLLERVDPLEEHQLEEPPMNPPPERRRRFATDIAEDLPKDSANVGTPIAAEQPVEFSAYLAGRVGPQIWVPFLVYAHVPSARHAVELDSQAFFSIQHSTPPDVSRVRSQSMIGSGAEIQIVPQLNDCQFNPPRATILWFEDWHRIDFRMRASASEPHRAGSVRFYVEAVLIGELPLRTEVHDDVRWSTVSSLPQAVTQRSYQAIFVSYSHDDSVIVDHLERAYSVLGMEYIRDVRTLRSGEAWNETLLDKIASADVFQLCWSNSAKTSRYVEREWRRALELQRREFIRPVYWERPMPIPPPELANLHFAQLPL